MVAALEKWSPTSPSRRSECETLAVEGDDARRLLPAMLQRVQPERGQRGGLRVAENAEHAAFLAQAVGVGSSNGIALNRLATGGGAGGAAGATSLCR